MGRKKENIIKEIFSYIRVITFAMVVSFLVTDKIVTHAQVPTGSMESTIMTGSSVILNKTAYWWSTPARGDIVAFYFPDDEEQVYLKRVIGLPGETIQIIEGQVYVDDLELEEPYLNVVPYGNFGPYFVPEESYFMMGDNRNTSIDSRSWEKKFVPFSSIIGKVKLEVFPQVKILE